MLSIYSFDYLSFNKHSYAYNAYALGACLLFNIFANILSHYYSSLSSKLSLPSI